MLLAADPETSWPDVINGLKEVAERTEAPWLVDYVHDALRDKTAFLFMDSSCTDSFAVLRVQECSYRNCKTLCVIAVYCKEGDANILYGREIDSIASEAGCSEIEFSSSRKGWEKAADRYGYKADHTVYRKKLNG
jgi:hypothetical protein